MINCLTNFYASIRNISKSANSASLEFKRAICLCRRSKGLNLKQEDFYKYFNILCCCIKLALPTMISDQICSGRNYGQSYQASTDLTENLSNTMLIKQRDFSLLMH
ncbi:unnamed protein product [Moneuplotes crassus]|uniref:Uncharacterized protein n=1 Tax=Euplotes crassus TaxID=5936 RepID=A0AAD2D8E0_EUPCR|nr:unnamed protein product [Moneuplotes crassus]